MKKFESGLFAFMTLWFTVLYTPLIVWLHMPWWIYNGTVGLCFLFVWIESNFKIIKK